MNTILAANEGISFSVINDTMVNAINTQETSLRAAIQSAGNNPTTTQLLSLQQQIQQWTILTDLQATLSKTIADAMRGVIQKSA